MLNCVKTVSLAFALASFSVSPLTAQAIDPEAEPSLRSKEAADESIRALTAWVIASGDNNGAPFIVIDKMMAKVFVFDSQRQFVGATPALLGAAVGDDSVTGVGERKMSAIRPEERTTPAGRFVSSIGPASGHRDVLWVDFASSVSLHPLVAVRNQSRMKRLQSPSPNDNRITYGCINVPAPFYAKIVRPLFMEKAGVVYIIPETKALGQVFPAFAATGQPARRSQASH